MLGKGEQSPKRESHESMFDDPTPNPYPEFDAEVFELYWHSGVAPNSLDGQEALDYACWLATNKAEEILEELPMANEKQLDLALESALRDNEVFRDWFLSRTKRGAGYRRWVWSRSNHPWGTVKVMLPNDETGALEMMERQGETDVLVVFENDQHERLGIHIENKLATGSFTRFQPEVCAARAEAWVGRAEYQSYEAWETVLVAPNVFYEKHKAEARKFTTFISHEDLSKFVAAFGGGTFPST